MHALALTCASATILHALCPSSFSSVQIAMAASGTRCAEATMGIDRDLADFLLCAKNEGVDFRDSVTLGRLNLFADVRSLKAVFEKHGIRLSEDDIASIRGASGGYAEEFLFRLGARDPQSLDASAYEGASLLHDM